MEKNKELIMVCLLGLLIAALAIKVFSTNQRIIDKIEKVSAPTLTLEEEE